MQGPSLGPVLDAQMESHYETARSARVDLTETNETHKALADQVVTFKRKIITSDGKEKEYTFEFPGGITGDRESLEILFHTF